MVGLWMSLIDLVWNRSLALNIAPVADRGGLAVKDWG